MASVLREYVEAANEQQRQHDEMVRRANEFKKQKARQAEMARKKEEQFDPRKVDWAQLAKIYDDDPTLVALFERMGAWMKKIDSYWSFPPSSYSFTYPSGSVSSSATNVKIGGTALSWNSGYIYKDPSDDDDDD